MRSAVSHAGSLARAALAAVSLLVALPIANAAAQVVQVRLLEQTSGAPLPGAIVRLLRDDREVATALTDGEGRVVLRAPISGTYSIRVNRIGYAPMSTAPFALELHQLVTRDLTMTAARITLSTVVVSGSGRCEARLPEGTLGATLWEDIRTALTANVLTMGQWRLPLHVREFRRDVDRRGDVIGEWVIRSRISHGPPFGALPADSLASRGFVFEAGGDVQVFAAPDAALLVSDAFVSTHCFGAVSDDQDRLGLAFEPLPGRRVPDVRGMLWVNRATNELEALDYSYTGLPSHLRNADLGGRIEFRRLPTGAWIVSYWHIRMPQVETRRAEFSIAGGFPRQTRGAVSRVIGYVDHGGRVNLASESGPLRAVISGRVFDSTAMAPIEGAVVRIRGRPDSVVTDEEGLYELAIPEGDSQVVVARHYKLGLIEDGSRRPLRLSLGDSTIVDFAVPPPEAFAREFCGRTSGRAGVVGVLWDAEGVPVEGLDLRVTWTAGDAVREARAVSGPGGLYALCDLPVARDLAIEVRRTSDATRRLFLPGAAQLRVHLRLEAREYRWQDVRP